MTKLTLQTKPEPQTELPLEDLAGDKVINCLRNALVAARRDLDRRRDEVRDQLREALEHLEVYELVMCYNSDLDEHDENDDRPGRTTCLRSASLIVRRGEVPDEFLLIPFGEVEVERPLSGHDFEFTSQHAAAAVAWFDTLDRQLAIDYEHQSFGQFNTRPDGLRPAAGWIGELEVRHDGLWATDVTWTDQAREFLLSGAYRYFSPVIFWKDKDCRELLALGPVALTNDPAMRGVTSLAGRDLQTNCEEAFNDDGDDEPNESDADLQTRLDQMQRELETTRSRLRRREAESFVERGMFSGKIVDSSSMEWLEAHLSDPEDAERRLAAAPVVLPPGRVTYPDASKSTSPSTLSMHNRAPVEPEDLEAFDRAASAGLVVRYAGNNAT